jgi:hypothetical protein
MKPLALLISLGWMVPAGTVVNFDSGPVGRIPAGWTVAMTHRGAPPQWQILQDGSAPTQPYVLAQTSTDASDRCPLAILDSVTLKDGDVSVRIKPVSGKEDRAGGVVWRYRDPDNYYLVRVNSLTRNVVVYKVRNGVRTQVSQAAQHEIPANAWSILKVSARGDRFQIYVDHRRILQGSDRTFGGAGKVGLWTVADSVTYFDDFRVYPK